MNNNLEILSDLMEEPRQCESQPWAGFFLLPDMFGEHPPLNHAWWGCGHARPWWLSECNDCSCARRARVYAGFYAEVGRNGI